nr:methyltransferase [Gammaproteobacteria bacterium]
MVYKGDFVSSLRILATAAISLAIGGVVVANPATSTGQQQHDAHADARATIAAIVDGDWRSENDKARDAWRHPREALEFWGLKPGMTILEVQPGAGYWTEILAPFAHRTGGKYYATGADLDDPGTSENARRARAAFEQRLASKPDLYGKATLVNWGAKSAPLPENTFDFILAARVIHGWLNSGMAEKAFAEFYRSLKPGGILAVEQHRAKSDNDDPSTGYVSEARVIALAEKAGLKLVARSEINANPKDTADHPFGVWTLPPTRRSPSEPDPSFDRAKYDAIGESDRMTLKFVKP